MSKSCLKKIKKEAKATISFFLSLPLLDSIARSERDNRIVWQRSCLPPSLTCYTAGDAWSAWYRGIRGPEQLVSKRQHREGERKRPESDEQMASGARWNRVKEMNCSSFLKGNHQFEHERSPGPRRCAHASLKFWSVSLCERRQQTAQVMKR